MINQLAAWEIFRSEIERNVRPADDEIAKLFNPLLDKNVIDQNCFEALVMIRQMAAFNQAIVEYLHPKLIYKQACVKAETLHFGTLYETIIKFYLIYKSKQKKSSKNEVSKVKPKESFYSLIQKFKEVSSNIFDESFFKMLHRLREDRNKIHFLEKFNIPEGEVVHEEFKLIEYRNKFNYFIQQLLKTL